MKPLREDPQLFKSYALAADGVIPILRRHMTNANWREIYKLPLVLDGRGYGDLCSACARCLECIASRSARTSSFHCEVTNADIDE